MAAALPVIGAIIGIGASVAGVVQSRRAASEAEHQARQAAFREQQETQEQLRRTQTEQRYQQSMARARAAAAGVSGESTNIYMQALEQAGQAELDWIEQVGATRYEQQIASGRTAANQAMQGFWGNVGSIGTGMGQLGQAWTTMNQ